ncbi:glycosyltransferase family 4 protein [Pseudomonas sediminis]|uniref:Glycosyltransferase family 4 protein n=1 Tax=Pseudomonas sediminis TaxID=1691904 RepID=A0ABX6SDF0_9PSED|nr:glycosyltransferase family 4 protein [Pseudomonas sediminis]QNG99596.1 glycosyltransferase family 4 protein [Pseudomonas sediminis]
MFKPKVLVFSSYFLPGEKSGGPVRTINNMLVLLGGRVDFYLITRAHDIDGERYIGVPHNEWVDCEGGRVYYFDGGLFAFINVLLGLRYMRFDFFYINSFFDVFFSILPMFMRRFGLYANVRFVLAPRGEFSMGALSFKSFRKRLFLRVSKLLSLYRGVIWQASSVIEKSDILRAQGKVRDVRVAPDLSLMPVQEESDLSCGRKSSGALRVVFLSRISPMKNLTYCFEVLSHLTGEVVFDVYGGVEDQKYWLSILAMAEELPPNIRFNYCGVVPNDQVSKTFAAYDLMFLPTLGENYGHVIFEALASGTPVLTSDRTPWRELSVRSAGWALNLEYPDEFVRTLQFLVGLDHDDYIYYRRAAFSYAKFVVEEGDAVDMNLELFRLA